MPANVQAHSPGTPGGPVSDQDGERSQTRSIGPSQSAAGTQAPNASAPDAAGTAHTASPELDGSPDRFRAAPLADAAPAVGQAMSLIDIAPVTQPQGTHSVGPALGTASPAGARSVDGGAGPAAQAAPILLSLASRGGASEVSLQLTPGELGHMHVRIIRDQTGGAAVSVTVERPETLTLLVGDQAALHRALDKAGVSAQDRSLTFHLATPEKGAPAPAPMPDMNGDTAGHRAEGAQDWSQSYGDSGSRSASGDPGQQRREPARAEPDWTGDTARGQPSVSPRPASQSARAGVDITA